MRNDRQFLHEGVDAIVEKAFIKKHLFNNYYGLDLSNVSYCGNEDNLFLIKPFEGYSRLYMMANDGETIVKMMNSLPHNCCINIPTKKGIEEWIPLLDQSGYKQIATYKRYCYTNYRNGNNKRLSFAELRDLPIIKDELHNFFSPLTGHLPNEDELKVMIKERQIVVNRDEKDGVNGALCCVIKGKKADLPFWFDRTGNGLSLLFNVFYLCHKSEVRQIVFWVNDLNTSTIAIHQMLGAKADGLVDYIFNKD